MSRRQLFISLGLPLAIAFVSLHCFAPIPLLLTDCDKYGSTNKLTAKNCPNGDFYGGLCYRSCAAGSKRTAACTCDYGTAPEVWTDCAKFANGPCPDGWFKSAACTCQRGGIETNCDKYGAIGPPQEQCGPGEEPGPAGFCYKPCPPGTHRTAVCTCST